ncbi:hypothetical protein K7711_43455 [Nocardia sp. CA2R105]|uniref:hypothetical protein n=1 Tax=Nocardia coffeae TaxID=2873381 RepID=UPI001CA5F76A|nr:hypothetical protein [Nocardia coffeae]MBY8863388.1 hypothetical protein [Nocardia coffeae]
MFVLRSPDARHASQVSSMAQFFGYLLAAVGPVVLGAVRQSTGGWTIPLIVLIVLLAAQAAAGLGAAVNRYAAPAHPHADTPTTCPSQAPPTVGGGAS